MSARDILSPASTTSSLASDYDVVSRSSDDDIILWGMSDSEGSQLSSVMASSGFESDDDFILLQMPASVSTYTTDAGPGTIPSTGTDPITTPVTTTSLLVTGADDLADSLAQLSVLEESPHSLLGAIPSYPQPDAADSSSLAAAPLKEASKPSAIVIVASSKKSRAAKRKRARQRKTAEKARAQASSSASPSSERSEDSLTSAEDQTRLFEEASNYITAYLAHPEAKENQVCKLTLLQSLLIELGLAKGSSALPTSLRAATQIIKSTVFINIKEYLLVRTQGPQAILAAMYPSRSALVKAMRKKANRAPLQWVKDHGLNVLLVSCFR